MTPNRAGCRLRLAPADRARVGIDEGRYWPCLGVKLGISQPDIMIYLSILPALQPGGCDELRYRVVLTQKERAVT